MKKIFICGESYVGYTVHIKGADEMTTQSYTENIHWLRDALMRGDCSVDYMPSHVALSSFPDTVEKLNVYDLVILSDVGANTLLMTQKSFPGGLRAPNRCTAIKEYVLQGGSFLMIGGFMSFTGIEGKAHYGTTAIADILPVDLLPYDDRMETPEGTFPKIIDQSHTVFNGIEGDWPYVIGYNKTLENSEKGVVIARVQQDPFIAIGEFGKGRSAAYTSDCAPHWASPDFMSWKHYDTLFQNIVNWLTENRK